MPHTKRNKNSAPKQSNVEPNIDTSPKVSQREKINFDLDIRCKFELTPKQKEFIDLIHNKNTKIILCAGPAGCSKSFLGTLAALQALNERKISEILYIRNPVESSSFNLGFLPGSANDKISPYLMPLRDKLSELLSPSAIKRLTEDGPKEKARIQGNTVGFLRGASINASYVLCDECQNFKVPDFLLTMTRLGKFSKFIYLGDIRQSDINNSGFEKIYNLFDNEESRQQGICVFKFGREDIVREPVISYILDKFEELENEIKNNAKKPKFENNKLGSLVNAPQKEEEWQPKRDNLV